MYTHLPHFLAALLLVVGKLLRCHTEPATTICRPDRLNLKRVALDLGCIR